MLTEIELDKSASIHLYLQLYNQIRDLIKEGYLTANTKLPPIRKLAQQLQVNNVTVVKAYDLLEEDELVYKQVGSGTFVAPPKKIESTPEERYLDEEVYIDEATKFSSNDQINFATAAPNPDLFPIQPFKKLVNKVLDRDKGYAFGYQQSQGYAPLREAIANYVVQEGITSQAEEIQIVSGAQQGIDILAKTFLDYGDTVLVERPTYPGAISVFASRRAEIIELPILSDGIDLAELEAKLQQYQPKFLYLMPTYQNPTGYSYSVAKKKQLIKLAAEYELLIIEDDCVGNLNYEPTNNPSLKSLDSEGCVIYIKSFSKIFMPGLRLAFLIMPDQYFDDILLAKYMSDIFTDGLVQRVLDLYFREEVWEEQLAEVKQTYQSRYQQLLASLEAHLPAEVDFIPPGGGLNIWLKLPASMSAQQVQQSALKQGVNVAPGSFFYANKPLQNRLRLSIAAVPRAEITAGIKQLATAINQQLKPNYGLDDSGRPLV